MHKVVENINQFKYLVATIKVNNKQRVKIINCIHKTEKTYHGLSTFFKSKLFLRKTKLRLFVTVVKQSLTYE